MLVFLPINKSPLLIFFSLLISNKCYIVFHMEHECIFIGLFLVFYLEEKLSCHTKETNTTVTYRLVTCIFLTQSICVVYQEWRLEIMPSIGASLEIRRLSDIFPYRTVPSFLHFFFSFFK